MTNCMLCELLTLPCLLKVSTGLPRPSAVPLHSLPRLSFPPSQHVDGTIYLPNVSDGMIARSSRGRRNTRQ
eukprot:750922-Hanusia_phi.AAC.4